MALAAIACFVLLSAYCVFFLPSIELALAPGNGAGVIRALINVDRIAAVHLSPKKI